MAHDISDTGPSVEPTEAVALATLLAGAPQRWLRAMVGVDP
jgi:hypothetical protein